MGVSAYVLGLCTTCGLGCVCCLVASWEHGLPHVHPVIVHSTPAFSLLFLSEKRLLCPAPLLCEQEGFNPKWSPRQPQ